MVKRLLPYSTILCIIICCLTFCAYQNDDNKERDQPEPVNTAMIRTAPPLPKTISFAGEAVPMDRWEIRDLFDRELVVNYYATGSMLYVVKLSQRWFPLIEERLKANGIPDDFKYLCVAESNLQNLISKVGATGFWQFMPGTAPSYGLEVNSEVDERYHVLKSTDAACKYIQQAYDKLGSWTAAAASYNCGQGGYNVQAIFQRSANYYDLMLPEETNRYIFRILTFKYLLEDAGKMGFVVNNNERYAPLKLRGVPVTKSIPNLVSFAQEQGVNYKVLKICNPWLRGRSLTARAGKQYVIMLPEN
jgi:membrane-bound lytic murein transglycosylase D